MFVDYHAEFRFLIANTRFIFFNHLLKRLNFRLLLNVFSDYSLFLILTIHTSLL